MYEPRRATGSRGAALRLALRILHALVIAHQLLAALLARTRAEAARLLPFLFRPTPRISRGKRPAFPTVVALVVAEEWAGDASLDSLASLVHWHAVDICIAREPRRGCPAPDSWPACCRCSAAGLQHIQVFDPAGEAKRSAAALGDRLNFAKEPLYSIQVGFGDSSRSGAQPACTGSGLKTVRLLDGRDAVVPLLAAAQLEAAGRDGDGAAEGGANTPSAGLTSQLRRAAGGAAVQAPELVLAFGPARSLAGFPPWLARQSEIYAAGRLADAREALVSRCLARYCRTSQRFGA